ncbi:MAG: hypothetical protein LBS84_07440, partial [Clostridiales bacterium]|nr:hypothetical protein [Clostridiales bacterium]
MVEHKNLKIICAVAAIIICVAAGGLHYMTRILRVSETDIIAFADKTGINPRRERAILRSVLLNTGQWRDWGSMDKANVG